MNRSWSSVLYDCGVYLAVHTLLAPHERLRIRRRRSRPAELAERLGRWTPPTRTGKGRLLVHAVSVGEVAAAAALITALGEIAPDLSAVLSTGNREGRAAAELLRRSCPAIEAVTFLPWDRRRSIREWLGRIAPDAVIVIETEIWPNLFLAAGGLGIPLFVANGRIYPRDVNRYRLARGFFARVLEPVSWIGVQSQEAREAFIHIGAPIDRVEVVGDLKLDAPGPIAEIPDGWRTVLDADGTPLVVAGSTHHPEELVLLRTLRDLRESNPDLRLVLAPRHPGRATRLQRRAEALSFSTALWSAGPTSNWDVLLIDRIGPLAAIYRWADVVVIGGSFARRGGHNPLEAAAAGRCILVGPSFEHFQDLVEGMLDADGIRVLPSTDDPAAAIRMSLLELLADPGRRRAMGQKALEFLQARQGIAGRYARGVLARIDDRDEGADSP